MELYKKIRPISLVVVFALLTASCQEVKLRKFSELPKVGQNKKRVYVAVQNQRYLVTDKEIGISPAVTTGLIVLSLVAAHNTTGIEYFAKNPFPQPSQGGNIKTDFLMLEGDDIHYVSTLSYGSLHQFLDVDIGREYNFAAGATQAFLGYGNNIARKPIQFKKDKWVDILSLGQRHRKLSAVELEKIKNSSIDENHPQFSDESEEPEQYSYGITHLKMRSEDALFCENLRIENITEKELLERIEKKSKNYLNEKSYLESSPRFNFACLTIANARSVQNAATKKALERVNKNEQKFSLKLSKVEKENYDSSPIYLKPLR